MSSTRGSSRIVLIAASILFIAVGQAGASIVLFNTFGPGDSYNLNTGATLGGPPGMGIFVSADQFSFAGSQSYLLDSVELAAGWIIGDNQLNLSLMTDAAGLPGAVLESFSFTNQMGSFGDLNPLLVGASVTHPLLTPGTPYWLVASVPQGAWSAWDWSSPAVVGTHAFSQDGGPWSVFNDTIDAFRVNGVSAVPAPGALLLGVIGLGCLRGLRRRSA